MTQLAILILSFASSFFVARATTGSQEISIAFALLSATIPSLIARAKRDRERAAIESIWPEVIETTISALHAGRTISEALVDLSLYGPPKLQRSWQRISSRISSGERVESVLSDEAGQLQSPRADQFFATLIFAKSYGGSSVQSSLRHLSSFIRDDQQMSDEIETRFGWIRNSAILAAAAPWILLLILSTQPSTVEAFATDGGKLVLSIGVIFTAIAYLWMAKISQLPASPRVFNFDLVSKQFSASQANRSSQGRETTQ